jgi:Mn-dependent transcriptional regulator
MSDDSQYLVTVFIAEESGTSLVPFELIAERLDRSPATVTEMCQRLADRDLVVYRPYEGVRLTDDGRETAAEIHENYVTLSWFFRDVLALDDPEKEALEISGAVSPLVVERLAETLLGGETLTTTQAED